MFSKYKKTDATAANSAASAIVTPLAPVTDSEPKPASMRRAAKPAAASPIDKEVKRKQRMSEIKLCLLYTSDAADE